jgi:hypothetical protein
MSGETADPVRPPAGNGRETAVFDRTQSEYVEPDIDFIWTDATLNLTEKEIEHEHQTYPPPPVSRIFSP